MHHAGRDEVDRLSRAPHGPPVGEPGLDFALDDEGNVPARAVPVRRDAPARFEHVDVDLHLVGLMDERLVGQDVLVLVGEGRKVLDRRR